jgi:hypothetical protein
MPYADQVAAARKRIAGDPRANYVTAVLDWWQGCDMNELTVADVLDALDQAAAGTWLQMPPQFSKPGKAP